MAKKNQIDKRSGCIIDVLCRLCEQTLKHLTFNSKRNEERDRRRYFYHEEFNKLD